MKLTKSNSNDDRRHFWNSCYHLHNLNGMFSLFIFVYLLYALCPLPLLNMRLLQIVVPALLECVLIFLLLLLLLFCAFNWRMCVICTGRVRNITKYVIQLLWAIEEIFSFLTIGKNSIRFKSEEKKGAHNQNYWCVACIVSYRLVSKFGLLSSLPLRCVDLLLSS